MTRDIILATIISKISVVNVLMFQKFPSKIS